MLVTDLAIIIQTCVETFNFSVAVISVSNFRWSESIDSLIHFDPTILILAQSGTSNQVHVL